MSRIYKKPSSLLSQLLPSAAATSVVLLFGLIIAACGGSRTAVIPGVPTPSGAAIVRVSSHSKPKNAIFPTGNGVFTSALFTMFQANPTLGQSFEGDCQFGNNPNVNGSPLGAHTEYGNTGFVALNVPNFQSSCGTFGVTGQLNPAPLTAIGAGDGTTPRGSAIFTPGTISALVAAAFTSSGKQIFCRDTTNTQAVTDGQAVLPYLRLSDNAILLGSSSTQLAPVCQLPLASGDDIVTVTVNWAKD